MNHESELKLQAHLDHELPPDQARQVDEWLARDEEARSVYRELQAMKELLGAGELERAVPESREFYWSKIERRISAEATPEAEVGTLPLRAWWLRLAAPLAGAGLLVAAFLLALNHDRVGPRIALSHFHEIEAPIEESTAISFHSEAAQMTVVWIQSQEK